MNIMHVTKRLFVFCLLAGSTAGLSSANAQQGSKEASQLIGRWNITIEENGKALPAWLEVRKSGLSRLVGSFVGTHGSARPVAEVKFDKGNFRFAIPPQWEEGVLDLTLFGELTETGIAGTMISPNGQQHVWTGVRAPALNRQSEPVWGQPIEIFNGRDLNGWYADAPTNQWTVRDGILTNPKAGSNLITEQKFEDFKLRVEFRFPKGSNAGVYLRGRYEVQIEDSPRDAHPDALLYSGVYGFITPSEITSPGPDVWHTYDITLVGRKVTIVANGKTVISNQEIPGITGGALDSNEGEPGPIYLQGDHGPVEFRKIVITPAR